MRRVQAGQRNWDLTAAAGGVGRRGYVRRPKSPTWTIRPYIVFVRLCPLDWAHAWTWVGEYQRMNISALRTPSIMWKWRRAHRRDREQVQVIARIVQSGVMAVCLVTAAALAGVALYGFIHADRIYEGVTVAGVSVGGLSESEARARIEERDATFLAATVPVTDGDATFHVSPRDAGMELDGAATANAAFAYGRSGSIWDRAGDWVRAALGETSVVPAFTVDEERLDAVLVEIAHEVTRPPVNAAVVMSGANGPTIRPEEPGLAFDLTTTRARILDRFASLSTDPVPMALPAIAPAITTGALTQGLDEAKAAVASPLVLSAFDRSWVVASEDLKRIVSVPSEGGQVRVDQASVRGLIANIAVELDRPGENAGLYVTDEGELAISPAIAAVDVDVDASLEATIDALIGGDHAVELVVAQEAPPVTDDMAEAAMVQAEALINDGVELSWEDGSAQLGRGDLLASITIRTDPGNDLPFVFGFDETVLSSLLEPITAEIDIEGRDATFRLEDGEVAVVEKEKTGRRVDVPETVALINEAVLAGEPRIDVPIDPVEPTYTAADRSKIKVKDSLGDSSTYYGNSSDPRRRNVEQAVKLETGWLIPPDGVFSYNEYIGQVTEEQGFVTGFGIVSNGAGGVTTAPVIGGGICQVSTTIFQAGFWAGLAVVERWTHPYWINTYGEAPRGMKGLDAMVNIEEDWSLDLKLRNTTGNWIAIVVRADGERVSAEVLGTDAGRQVDVQGPTITNVITPSTELIVTESPELPAGQELQVESAQEGFDASIRRIIIDGDGQVIDDTTIAGTYAASHNTILRGTGQG